VRHPEKPEWPAELTSSNTCRSFKALASSFEEPSALSLFAQRSQYNASNLGNAVEVFVSIGGNMTLMLREKMVSGCLNVRITLRSGLKEVRLRRLSFSSAIAFT